MPVQNRKVGKMIVVVEESEQSKTDQMVGNGSIVFRYNFERNGKYDHYVTKTLKERQACVLEWKIYWKRSKKKARVYWERWLWWKEGKKIKGNCWEMMTFWVNLLTFWLILKIFGLDISWLGKICWFNKGCSMIGWDWMRTSETQEKKRKEKKGRIPVRPPGRLLSMPNRESDSMGLMTKCSVVWILVFVIMVVSVASTSISIRVIRR